ncbi:hypothetical protein CPB86DRAFT_475981 [Serendipita vermifera]|nr:hypothetical protein CPB86DRAFT_475981 [Serendipita vermifera]
MRDTDLPPTYGASTSSGASLEIPPLPPGVTMLKVYSDFIRYLYGKTRAFFVESTPNGQNVWNRLKQRTVLIFCTPNGWDVSHQVFLRHATARAGVMAEKATEERVEFIAEGEASVHYVVAHMKSNEWLKKNMMFGVIDAGGSTVDSTLYECKNLQPLELEEVCASECVQAGGIFVDRAAKRVFEDKLGDSAYNEEDYLTIMTEEFERKTKRIFDGTQTSNVINFGGPRDNDRDHGILKGKLTLTRAEVSTTFDDVVAKTVNSNLRLLRGRKIQHLLLVGGFGESPFLRKRLKENFASQETDIITVDEPSKKAAADGSVIWYLKELVTARAARYTIGTESGECFDSNNLLHRTRQHIKYNDLSGQSRINMFSLWAKKDAPLATDWTNEVYYTQKWENFPGTVGKYTVEVLISDQDTDPTWVHDISGNLMSGIREMCTIEADLKDLVSALNTKTGIRGNKYWELAFSVRITYKGTKLQARLIWKDGQGQKQEGPACILPGVAY